MMRDDDLGIVRVRAFGTFDFHVVDPKLFLKEVAGSDQNFRLDEFADTMRSRIVSVFADALATAKIPVFDVASRYTELGEALLPLINPVDQGEVRPRDVELHPRERVGAAGSRAGGRQALEHGGGRQPERLREVPDGAGDGEGRQRRRPRDGDGGRPLDRAADDPAAGGHPRQARRRRPAPPRWRRIAPELLSPGDVANALKVSEGDVLAILESGELAGKKIGSTWRIKRSALDEYLAK